MSPFTAKLKCPHEKGEDTYGVEAAFHRKQDNHSKRGSKPYQYFGIS
jgi:hypothetical protein